MTDLERLDQTIKRLESQVSVGGGGMPQALFYIGVLQFLRGVLATETGEKAEK